MHNRVLILFFYPSFLTLKQSGNTVAPGGQPKASCPGGLDFVPGHLSTLRDVDITVNKSVPCLAISLLPALTAHLQGHPKQQMPLCIPQGTLQRSLF